MEDDEEVAELRIASVRGLLMMLQAIKPASKQDCVVTLKLSGVTIRMEDAAKGLQAKLSLKPELFSSYYVPHNGHMFGLPFRSLTDVLQVVMASTASSELVMRYPGPNNDLQLMMSEDNLCTYAGVDTVETDPPGDLLDHWTEPASTFIAPALMLKEAVDDLEWAAAGGQQSGRATVHLHMRRDPRRLVLLARGAGQLKIEFPADECKEFRCQGPQLRWSYKLRHLRAAFCNIPNQKEHAEVRTKVTIDARGVMKVAHLISMAGSISGGVSTEAGGASQLSSFAAHAISQQNSAVGRHTADVQFVIMCEDDDEDEYEQDML